MYTIIYYGTRRNTIIRYHGAISVYLNYLKSLKILNNIF